MAIDTDIPTEKQRAELSDSSEPRIHDRENEVSLLDILIVLANRKRFILSVTLVCGIVGLLVALILPKRYTAVATLLPPQQSSSLGSALSSQLGSLGAMASLAGRDLNLKNPNDMYVAMFGSRTVEDAMIQRFGLMQEYKEKYPSLARKKFESNFAAAGNGKDGLIHISVQDRDPKRAADMANGWIDQFRKLSQILAITEASQRRLFFEQQMEQAKDKLANAEQALKQTQQTTGMIQLDSQARALIESAATLRAQIAAKEVQLQAMHTYATNENSNVVQTQQELDGLRAQLAKLGGSEGSSSADLIIPKGKVPEAGLEYIRKFRDVKYYETVFDILARQFEIAKLDEAREGALVQVVDPAVPPDRKSSPHRSVITIAAVALGFLLGVFIALFKAFMARVKEDPVTAGKLALLKRALGIRSPSLS
jgi:tyrosine-protein kinase Etk/Wzc